MVSGPGLWGGGCDQTPPGLPLPRGGSPTFPPPRRGAPRLPRDPGEIAGRERRGGVEGLVAARHREAYLDPTHRELRSATLDRLECLHPVIAVLIAEAGNSGGRHLSKQGIELVVGVEDGDALFRQRRH